MKQENLKFLTKFLKVKHVQKEVCGCAELYYAPSLFGKTLMKKVEKVDCHFGFGARNTYKLVDTEKVDILIMSK